jgi:hypothetical protein
MTRCGNGVKWAQSCWLQNMSVPATTTVRHTTPHPERNYGKGIIVSLAFSSGAADFAALLQRLDDRKERAYDDPAGELRGRLNEHAQSLSWPSAMLVTDQPREGDDECEDLLTILTVIAKSSDRVYLRDKEPNLNSLLRPRRLLICA